MADTKNFLDKTGLQRLVTNLKNLFLSKTNTTQYTPTANYHPATKKYVDDNKYTLPTASSSTKGGIKVGTNLTIADGVLSATDTTYSAATTSAAGLMSASDKSKLDGIATGANKYSLPTASASTLGGIKVGSNLSINNGVLSATNTTYGAATIENAGLMSAADKSKLDGIASGANAYSLPTATSSVLGGVKVGSNINLSSGTISLTKANVTSALGYTPPTTNTTYNNASTTTAGLMSASDKSKLDGIASGANAYSLPTASASTLGGVKVGTNLSISNGVLSATNTTYSAATTSAAGLMSAADKTKLNGIATGATANSASTTTPKANGAASTGSESGYSRGDHVHPLQTTVSGSSGSCTGNAATATKVNNNLVVKLNGGSTEETNLFTFNGSAAKTVDITASSIGAAASSHGTHVTWSTTTPKANGTAAVGTETKVARGDHVHPLQTSVSGNAGTATKFASAQSVALTGDVTGSASSQAGWSVATTLANSGVTAGSYGPSANATPAYGATFNVPYITVDAKGRVTSASTKTVKIPASDNSDTKVTNTLATTTKAYVTGTTSATTSTGTQVFDTGVYLDTTAGMLTATTFKGALSGNASTATTATKANQLTTARTFTIGAASDTFDGTGDVSFDLDDIGAADASVTNAKFTSIEADIATLFANINQQGEVTSVKTTQGWTFNNSGMNIGTTSTFNTAITTSGATFKNGSTAVTTINGSGLTATTINNQGAYQYGYAGGTYLFKDELVTINGEYAVATFYNGT